GFGTHGHRDMEIISYVVDGELAHRDSMGTGSVIRPGDVQRMTAGTGVTHSEMNASEISPVHFLQIWIVPGERGLAPGYEQKHFAPETRQNQWRLVGAQDGREGAVTIHQDVSLYAATLEKGAQLEYGLASERKAWLQVVKGSIALDGETLNAGDGAAIVDMNTFSVAADDEAEVLLFDLAA
ncbi:MAG: pirin family protein, partial [Cyanobacteria bacterium J06631_9]